MVFPMDSTIVAEGEWCPESGHRSPLAVNRSGFHVPVALYSHKTMIGLRCSLKELD